MASATTAQCFANSLIVLRCRGIPFFATAQRRKIPTNAASLLTIRWKSSSSVLVDMLPESVRDTVKTSVLDQAAQDDSRLWSRHQQHEHQHKVNGGRSNGTTSISINESTSKAAGGGAGVPLHDPLDDLYNTSATRYWPHLPPSVLSGTSSNETTTTATPATATTSAAATAAAAAAADPFALASSELRRLSESIRRDLIGTDHPVLNRAAAYFFDSSSVTDGGKKVRPAMVLLLSRALANSASHDELSNNGGSSSNATTADSNDGAFFTAPLHWQRPDLPAAQRRLAEISEMIHTASLFHDDVIDGSDTRRGAPAVHMVFGNKMAILAGDYLLARASICLARLRHVEVVETMSTIIEHLVRGEVMQLRGTTPTERSGERLRYYLRKNFYKTGSLMANSCKSAALLGDYPTDLVDASYRFGKHVGMAFQLVDDVLDFEGSLSQLGKPALADLRAGLATAPVLLAAEERPGELEPLMDRKFQRDGDVDRAVELVAATSGMERTKEMARVHAEIAMDAILELHPSVHRDALVHLASKVVARTK